MKLFVIAAFVTVCSAGRLEHLEHQQSRYLPPGQDSDASPSEQFGVNSDGTSGNGHVGSNARNSISRGFDSDHSSDKEPSASAPESEFEGYVYGPGIPSQGHKAQNHYDHQSHNEQFGQPEASQHFDQQAQNPLFTPQATKQQYGQQPQSQQQYQVASQVAEQDATALGSNSIAQARFYPKPSSPSGQYYAPHSSQNAPQQSFDEETGYHY